MKILTIEVDGSITAKDGLAAWNYVTAVEAAKQVGEFTAPELAAAPAVAAKLTDPATLAALVKQRAAPLAKS
jgi:hypothetical protein